MASDEHYSPPDAVEFFDGATMRQMMLGTYCGEKWLFWKHPDGQWVTQRKATADDLSKIDAALAEIPARAKVIEQLLAPYELRAPKTYEQGLADGRREMAEAACKAADGEEDWKYNCNKSDCECRAERIKRAIRRAAAHMGIQLDAPPAEGR